MPRSIFVVVVGVIGPVVKLSHTYTIQREPSNFMAAVSGTCPKVMSSLNSLLETAGMGLL